MTPSRCDVQFVQIGSAPVQAAGSATRVSSAGSCPRRSSGRPRSGVDCCGRTRRAEPIGYRAIEALRMEKGHRYYGTDLTMQETPFEAGLGVSSGWQRPFIGRDALVEAHGQPVGRPLRTLVIGDATTSRSTAGRPSGSTARSSAASAASPMARPSTDDRLRLPTGIDARRRRVRDRRLRSTRRRHRRPRCHRRRRRRPHAWLIGPPFATIRA